MKRAAAVVNVAAVLTHYGYRAVNCVGTVAADAQCFEQSRDSVHFKAYYSVVKEVLRVSRGRKVLFDGEPADLEKALIKIHQIPLPGLSKAANQRIVKQNIQLDKQHFELGNMNEIAGAIKEVAAERRDPIAKAAELINAYGKNQNTAESVARATGCTEPEAVKAIAEAERAGRVPTAQGINFADPKYRFQERVAACVRKGLSREDAEETIKNVIAYKEQEPLAKEGATVRLDKLLDGQRFKNEVRDERNRVRNTYTGCVLYRTPGRVRVLLDAGPSQERSFTTRDGDNVTIHSSGRKEQNYAPDVEVIVLAGREDTALLLGKKDVQSSGDQLRVKASKVRGKDSTNSIPEREGDNMAAKKRAAKKSKANGESKRPRISAEAVVKRLKGPNDEQIKRHVDILSTLKENGDRMTVAELAKAFGKVAKTKQDPAKVFLMHRKALVDGGFITVTEPKAEAAAA